MDSVFPSVIPDNSKSPMNSFFQYLKENNATISNDSIKKFLDNKSSNTVTSFITSLLMASSLELDAHFFFNKEGVKKFSKDYQTEKNALGRHSRTHIKNISSWLEEVKPMVSNAFFLSIYAIVTWIMIAEPSIFLIKFLHDFDVHYLLKYLLGNILMGDLESESVWWSIPGGVKVWALATYAMVPLKKYAVISNALLLLFGRSHKNEFQFSVIKTQYEKAVEKDVVINKTSENLKIDLIMENPILHAYFIMKLYKGIDTKLNTDEQVEKDMKTILSRDTLKLLKCSDFFDANGIRRSSMLHVYLAFHERFVLSVETPGQQTLTKQR